MFTHNEENILYSVSLLFNALSFSSCLFTLFAYSKSRGSTSAQFKMAINIALSDTLIAITGFLSFLVEKGDSFYQINSYLGILALWSSAFWVSTVALLQYKKIAKERGFNSIKFYTKSIFVWFVLCAAFPLTFTIVTSNFLELEYAMGSNRFDKIPSSSQYPQLFIFIEVIPLVTSMLVTFVCYLKQVKILKQLNLFDMVDIDMKKLLKYPIAQTFIFAPSLIGKTWFIFSPNYNLVFSSIRLFGYYLAGIVNSFVYRIRNTEEQSVKGSFLGPKVFPSAYDSRRPTMVEDQSCVSSESGLEDL